MMIGAVHPFQDETRDARIHGGADGPGDDAGLSAPGIDAVREDARERLPISVDPPWVAARMPAGSLGRSPDRVKNKFPESGDPASPALGSGPSGHAGCERA